MGKLRSPCSNTWGVAPPVGDRNHSRTGQILPIHKSVGKTFQDAVSMTIIADRRSLREFADPPEPGFHRLAKPSGEHGFNDLVSPNGPSKVRFGAGKQSDLHHRDHRRARRGFSPKILPRTEVGRSKGASTSVAVPRSWHDLQVKLTVLYAFSAFSESTAITRPSSPLHPRSSSIARVRP